jgi:prepilin-type N-terminal cleavage/methylation domain-containing protein
MILLRKNNETLSPDHSLHRNSVSKNPGGFSLIELMMVVGMIGILAMIAVPNFEKFTAKARQSEAKVDLAAIFAAEKGFHSEYGSYTGCLAQAGFAGPSGNKRFYTIGFSGAVATIGQSFVAPATWTMCGGPGCCGPNGNQPCNLPDFNGAATCITAAGFLVDTDIAWFANSRLSGAGFPADAELAAIKPVLSQTQFSVPACGFISGSGVLDVWSINDAKWLNHVNEGI